MCQPRMNKCENVCVCVCGNNESTNGGVWFVVIRSHVIRTVWVPMYAVYLHINMFRVCGDVYASAHVHSPAVVDVSWPRALGTGRDQTGQNYYWNRLWLHRAWYFSEQNDRLHSLIILFVWMCECVRALRHDATCGDTVSRLLFPTSYRRVCMCAVYVVLMCELLRPKNLCNQKTDSTCILDTSERNPSPRRIPSRVALRLGPRLCPLRAHISGYSKF